MSRHPSWSDWFPETEAEYQERLKRSRQMSPEERFAEGFRLFDKECQMRRDVIRNEHPDMTDEEIKQTLIAQTEAQRRNEDEGIYVELDGPYPES